MYILWRNQEKLIVFLRRLRNYHPWIEKLQYCVNEYSENDLWPRYLFLFSMYLSPLYFVFSTSLVSILLVFPHPHAYMVVIICLFFDFMSIDLHDSLFSFFLLPLPPHSLWTLLLPVLQLLNPTDLSVMSTVLSIVPVYPALSSYFLSLMLLYNKWQAK